MNIIKRMKLPMLARHQHRCSKSAKFKLGHLIVADEGWRMFQAQEGDLKHTLIVTSNAERSSIGKLRGLGLV